MRRESDPREFLRARLMGAKCDLLRFPGNYGDALIWHGTRRILTDARLEYRTIQCGEPPTTDALIIDGGGNLVDLYDDVRLFLTTHAHHYRDIVILPHTITGALSMECLTRLGSKVVVFCRERVSYDAVSSSLASSDVLLWHDCAFSVALEGQQNHERSLQPTLFAFRTDVEASLDSGSLPAGNRDLSREGYAMSSLDHLTDVICGFERVITDRLHIAIAATLLGREVILHPNSYYKNRAVYEYSLSGKKNIVLAQ